MDEKTTNLMFDILRAIRADVAATREEVHEMKSRLSNVEIGIASLKRDAANQYAETAGQHVRYDKLVERIERIEKRLEITPA